MIAYLKGTLIQKKPNQIILDVRDVGYSIGVPLSTYLKLSQEGEKAELFIYTHATDNSLKLYGFVSDEERRIFLKLISISGIGPKIGLSILSGIEVSDLKNAIRESDVARISLIPGIGKKTAMRIALELQEKLGKKEIVLGQKISQEEEDLISALINMGFKRKEAEKTINAAIKDLSLKAGFEALLREGLKRLAKL